jgi:hypothetical protein
MSPRHALRLVAFLALGSSYAFAGGGPENALLIVDPSNAESLLVANHYRAARGIPDGNVVYMAPTPATYAQFVGSTLEGFLGSLENLSIADHVDFVVLPSGGSFYVDAPGLVSDECSPVTRFSSIAPFVLAREKDEILAGTDSGLSNGYFSVQNTAQGFRSSVGWSGGSQNPSGSRYFVGAMLGYTGALGNTVDEVIAMIDRSVAVDATLPAGTIEYMHTSDPARSGPRDGSFPSAVNAITALGGSAQILFEDLPIGEHDCLGIMTGVADPDIDGGDFTVLPGAFCDHLTSYAGTLDSPSQTKMTRWIAKGASGTTGTVEEPCNYAGKFVAPRLHVFYEQGATLGEAWFESHGFAPFQTLFIGDPLTRPFAHVPVVDLAGLPAGAASDTLALTPSATTTHPTASIGSYQLLVDGVTRSTCGPGGHFTLDTTALADGVHEWRAIAFDDSPLHTSGAKIGTILVNNHGRGASLLPSSASGNLSTRFDFTASASGGTVRELRLLEGSRVVAASSTSPPTLSVHGRILGAGAARLVLEAEFTDGLLARSSPADVAIANSSVAPSGAAPIATSYTKHVLTTQSAVVELPATFDDALASASFAVPSLPAQSVLVGGGSGPYRILRPNAGATGTDTMTFQATTPSGASAVATVTIVYDAPFACTPPTNYCTSTPNSSGGSATLSWTGTTSLGTNDFGLYAMGLPARKLGIFIYGTGTTQVALGNGFRCVASPFFRLGATTSDDFGEATLPVDFTQHPANASAGAIRTGSTQHFQLWFRDPPAGGARTNLTDGLTVTICP